MNKLFIGQNSSGKTTNIKKEIDNIKNKGKVIILDFSNDYDGLAQEFLLDKINPILGEFSLDDVKALNAGYLQTSRCLVKCAEDILREEKSFNSNYAGMEFNEIRNTITKEGLIQESLDRLHISWNSAENDYGKILNSKIPIKKNRTQISFEKAISEILEQDMTVLKMKNMHSDHLRAVTFVLLSKISKIVEEPIYIVADDLSSFFNSGNLKMFLETIRLENLRFILSFNKTSNIPNELIPLMDTYYIHRFENNPEIKALKKMGIKPSKNLKTLKDGEYYKVEKNDQDQLHRGVHNV